MGFPFKVGQVLVIFKANASNGIAVQQADDRGVMVTHIGNNANNTICRDHAHVFFDAIDSSLVDGDVVVALVDAVVDNLCRNESVDAIAVQHM